ncbi:hypothetical protein ACJX0J_019500 [Zea mays]
MGQSGDARGYRLILEKCQTLDELYIDLNKQTLKMHPYIYNNQSGSVKHETILCHSQMKLKLVVLGQSGVGDRLKLALVTSDCCTSLVAGANVTLLSSSWILKIKENKRRMNVLMHNCNH